MIDYYLCPCETDTRTARKPHRCCECRGTIQPGERYRVTAGRGEDSWERYKECLDCVELREQIDSTIKDRYDQVPFTGLAEHVIESQDPNWQKIFRNIRKMRNSDMKIYGEDNNSVDT